MKPITIAALLVATSLIAGPAMARTPLCDWNYDATGEAEATDGFAQRLHLDGKFGASVDIWNGCYKVRYLGSDGKYRTEYYDPDSKRRID